jgi:putative membrane protein
MRTRLSLPAVTAGKLKRVRMIVHIELAAIVLILLCAAIMAKGGWV